MLPTVLSFVLCSAVRRDAFNTLSLVGLFDVLTADRFPAEFRDSWLYCALTDGRGDVNLTFRLTDAADPGAEPVITIDTPVQFRDPLQVSEVVLSLMALRFPEPGVYAWQVACDGEPIGGRRLVVRQASG